MIWDLLMKTSLISGACLTSLGLALVLYLFQTVSAISEKAHCHFWWTCKKKCMQKQCLHSNFSSVPLYSEIHTVATIWVPGIGNKRMRTNLYSKSHSGFKGRWTLKKVLRVYPSKAIPFHFLPCRLSFRPTDQPRASLLLWVGFKTWEWLLLRCASFISDQ